jgi:hypothetical protein
MAEHSVHVDLPRVEVLNKDLEIVVRADGEMFGRLTVSRGGLGWFSASDQLERPITWEQFDRFVKGTFGERL